MSFSRFTLCLVANSRFTRNPFQTLKEEPRSPLENVTRRLYVPRSSNPKKNKVNFIAIEYCSVTS